MMDEKPRGTKAMLRRIEARATGAFWFGAGRATREEFLRLNPEVGWTRIGNRKIAKYTTFTKVVEEYLTRVHGKVR